MDNFKVMYRILKHLEASLDCEITDLEPISPFRLNIKRERWEQILIMMQDEGYIRGIMTSQSLSDDKRHIVEPIQPVITIRGLEYLSDNTFMKKAAKIIHGVTEVVK